MKFALKFICLLICANLCLSELFCPIKKELPEETQKDSSYTWVSLEQLTNEYAIPSAFQPFLKEIEK